MSEQELPPHVRFAVHEEEPRFVEGKMEFSEIHVVNVTQRGSRNSIAFPVDLWLAQMEKLAEDSRLPFSWVERWKLDYERFKQGLAPTTDGTPLESWPGVSRKQVTLLKELGIFSVEEAAQMTSEAVQNLGMGGTDLKARAKAFLETLKNVSKVSEELAAIRVEREALREELKELKSELAKASAKNSGKAGS